MPSKIILAIELLPACVPMYVPFIDCHGRLKGSDRLHSEAAFKTLVPCLGILSE